ncbi:hypothetical protein DMJ13_26250 [halophilic archaeon]|nr:hypothetical protein DMJ13_26250 [halophilic archaeon]
MLIFLYFRGLIIQKQLSPQKALKNRNRGKFEFCSLNHDHYVSDIRAEVLNFSAFPTVSEVQDRLDEIIIHETTAAPGSESPKFRS